MRFRRMLALVVPLSLVFAACSGGDAEVAEPAPEPPAPAADQEAEEEVDPLEALIDAAQAEGSLTFYASTSPGVLDTVIPEFEAKYGISVEVLRLNSGDLTQRFLAEGENSEADVVEVPGCVPRLV